MKWISIKDKLPPIKDKPYQLITIAVKKYTGGNYNGEGIISIKQDWVIRGWCQNFTHWAELPKLPY